jgi:hypothetical protein
MTKALVLLFLFARPCLILAINPDHYYFTVTTTDNTYKNYRYLSRTDSTVTIYKAGTETVEAERPITLDYRKIISIQVIRTRISRAISYLAPVAIGSAIGVYIGGLRKSGAACGGFLGGALGLVAGMIIDLATTHTYQINRSRILFLEFAGHIKS